VVFLEICSKTQPNFWKKKSTYKCSIAKENVPRSFPSGGDINGETNFPHRGHFPWGSQCRGGTSGNISQARPSPDEGRPYLKICSFFSKNVTRSNNQAPNKSPWKKTILGPLGRGWGAGDHQPAQYPDRFPEKNLLGGPHLFKGGLKGAWGGTQGSFSIHLCQIVPQKGVQICKVGCDASQPKVPPPEYDTLYPQKRTHATHTVFYVFQRGGIYHLGGGKGFPFLKNGGGDKQNIKKKNSKKN